MPYVAQINKSGNWERIDITKQEHPKFLLSGFPIRCQDCQWPMYIRGTVFVRNHFAHMPNKDRECFYDNYGESEFHKRCKERLAELLSQVWEYKNAEISYEYGVVPKKPYGFHRYADVYVKISDKEIEVHEIQLSPITYESWWHRNNDYLEAGLIPVWWFGKNVSEQLINKLIEEGVLVGNIRQQDDWVSIDQGKKKGGFFG